MLLQLKPLFMGEIESLPIDAELVFPGWSSKESTLLHSQSG